MKKVKILILEDDIETNERILRILREIESNQKITFGVTILPDYFQTDEFINKNPHIKYDILLLDRDCYLGGSFHIVDLENFDKDKVIAISSVPEYNKQAMEKGVTKTVWKNFDDMEAFTEKLKELIVVLL